MEYPKLFDAEDRNITNHPFILDLGNPTAVISSNVLANKVSFNNFKGELERIYNESSQQISNNLVFAYFQDKVRYQKLKSIFSNFEVYFDDKSGILDRALELGMVFNFEEMVKSFEDTIKYSKQLGEEAYNPFFNYMTSLIQICELKVLEGKLLQLFSEQIERENLNGDISTMSAIQNSTAILYYVIQTPFAFFGKHRLHDEVKKLSKIADKDLGAKDKIQLLSKYANLPLIVYKNTLENMFNQKENLDEGAIKEYYESVNNSIMDIIDTNALIVDAVYEQFFGNKDANRQIDEDGELALEYVPQKDFVDPSIK